jgi:hypothetical protein
MPNGTPLVRHSPGEGGSRADQLVALARPAIRKLTGADLTPAEEEFFRKVAEGQVADFSSKSEADDDPANASQWKADRVLRAPCIAWLCTDPDATEFLTHRGILLHGARIDGDLDLQFAKIDVPLFFAKCAFAASIYLTQAELQSLTLLGTHTAKISASNLKLEGAVLLRNGFRAQGEVSLMGASIGGSLNCTNAQFLNAGGTAVSADGAKVGGAVFLCDGFKAEGEVRLVGASIDGYLDCVSGQFSNQGGKALNMDGLKVQGSVCLGKGFKAEGEVRLRSASIGGNLDCENGRFSNPGNDALSADMVKVEGAVFLRDGFKADGKVRLLGASIRGGIDCTKGECANAGNVALDMDGLKVEGAVFFRNGFKAEGIISLAGTEIGKHLQWWGVRNPEKAKLDLRSVKANTLFDEKASWPPAGQLHLQGFVYDKLDHHAPASAHDRIDWLNRNNENPEDLPKGATPSEKRAFFAQPYQQLASVLRNAGQEDEADEILIEKNKRVAQWTRKGSANWWWYRVIGPPIKYGYRPMVTFKWSLAIILLGVLLFGWGYQSDLITPTSKDAYREENGKPTSDIREDYPRFNSWIYSTEMFVPLVKFYQAEYWLPNANRGTAVFPRSDLTLTWGGALRIYLWLHIALGWTLTTIWVAGLTGIIKKSG